MTTYKNIPFANITIVICHEGHIYILLPARCEGLLDQILLKRSPFLPTAYSCTTAYYLVVTGLYELYSFEIIYTVDHRE